MSTSFLSVARDLAILVVPVAAFVAVVVFAPWQATAVVVVVLVVAVLWWARGLQIGPP
jgi:hypothetical protein